MRRAVIILALLATLLIPAGSATAHGVEITYTLTPVLTGTVEIAVQGPDGTPLAEAALAVFAPDPAADSGAADVPVTAAEPGADPWLRAELDDEGRFAVPLDPDRPGEWTFEVKQDGATAIARVPLEAAPGGARPGEGVAVMADGLAMQVAARPVTAVRVALAAAFDSGEAMSEAQVTIYTPDNAKTPWRTGLCDDEGRFSFIPDMAKTGTWEIQVRKAGHGEWLKLPVEAGMVEVEDAPADDGAGESAGQTIKIADSVAKTSDDGGLSSGQIVLMSASVIWGAVGTALYFAGRRREDGSDAHS